MSSPIRPAEASDSSNTSSNEAHQLAEQVLTQNDLARAFKALHVPGVPVTILEVWDVTSLIQVAKLRQPPQQDGAHRQGLQAVGMDARELANSMGMSERDLNHVQHLALINTTALAAKWLKIPLTVDLCDGYGNLIGDMIRHVVSFGAVGATIRDSFIPSCQLVGLTTQDVLYNLHEQYQRLRVVLAATAAEGCPDFVLNARCDVFLLDRAAFGHDPQLQLTEAVIRGKTYLAAGATTVCYYEVEGFGLRDYDLAVLVGALGGRMALRSEVVASRPRLTHRLTSRQMADFGVSRLDLGPSLFSVAMYCVLSAAMGLLEGDG